MGLLLPAILEVVLNDCAPTRITATESISEEYRIGSFADSIDCTLTKNYRVIGRLNALDISAFIVFEEFIRYEY
jgi:hypothetical protein